MNVLDENVSAIQRQLLREECALFVRRLLMHPELDTQAKRMGAVVRASYAGPFVWRLRAQAELSFDWG